MKPASSILTLAIAATAPLTNAHYTFSQLAVNGAAVGTDWEYIREHTRTSTPTKGTAIPSAAFRRNRSASSGASTPAHTIKAGHTAARGCSTPGPTQAHMTGRGARFRVFAGLLCGAGDAWCTHGADRIAFAAPGRSPRGRYLGLSGGTGATSSW
ncbi:glycosyl hydrolase family 61-domain-containing protein [Neofusicoccum parvum]|nr:glycosyl hydrolase family 61-domain-containing protein [Neofusicoccum parvum]